MICALKAGDAENAGGLGVPGRPGVSPASSQPQIASDVEPGFDPSLMGRLPNLVSADPRYVLY